MTEVWRPIVGWEGLYEVSETGRVRSLARTAVRETGGRAHGYSCAGRELTGSINKALGYHIFVLTRNGRRQSCYGHRLVCEAFNGPPPSGHEVAHADGCRTNNDYRNLRWATRRENLKDKESHGTQPRGDDLWFTKISDADVCEVLSSREPTKSLALRYGVSPTTIYRIKSGSYRQHALEKAA
jgi:hypothetical protein